MPRIEIPLTVIERDGTAPPAQVSSDDSDNHYVAENDGRVFLEVENEGVTSHVVEVLPSSTLTADGLTIGNLQVSIPAGATRLIGPFRMTTFKQDSDGMLHVDVSVDTDLKLRAYQLPNPGQN